MHLELLAVVACSALAASAYLTGVVRKLALSRGLLDIPNERSSHTTATPRGGGIAITVTVTLALVPLAALGAVERRLFLSLTLGGAAVALIGYLDDRYKLPARLRLLVHFGAAGFAVLLMGGIPPLQIGHEIVRLGWIGDAIAATGIVWAVNLFNFMDGIDGIAASEATFIAVAGSVLGWVPGPILGISLVGTVFGAACLGFLLWNWPPAKIFLGDIGSGYVGYFIGVLAFADMRANSAAPWVWLILGGLFFVDATVTLVRRFMRRERVQEAHRSHAYQWLARRWSSHRRVTLTAALLNLMWLLPCAIMASANPVDAAWLALVALAPLALLFIAVGSGRAERKTPPKSSFY